MRIRASLVLPLLLVAAPLLAVNITLKTQNYINDPGTTETQTITLRYQVFTGSTNCSSGGGTATTVQHVDSVTGVSFTAGASDSVLLTADPNGNPLFAASEQDGPFVSWGIDFSAGDLSHIQGVGSDNRSVCVSQFNLATHVYFARLYASVQTFDVCGTWKTTWAPGETVTFVVRGGVIFSSEEPMRFLLAGGSPNECTFLPINGDPSNFIHVTSDPWSYTYTLPASDADIPAVCLSSAVGTQHIAGNWRAIVYDSSCGCNRNQENFVIDTNASLPSCPLSCPADITVSNESGVCGAHVSYTAPTGPGTIACSQASGSLFPVGKTTVNCSSSAGPSCSFHVTVNDTQNPTITAPPDVTAAAGASCTASPSLGSPVVADNCGIASVTSNAPSSFPVGTTTVTWTVLDTSGNSATATQHVTVTDSAPPSVSAVTATPSVLWPPNHTMTNVTLAYTASDNCTAPACSVSVSSNEPQNGLGDGDTAPDWQIVDATHVRLRAERAGNGGGRVYTITVTCVDGSGNATNKSTTVTVPVSQK